SEFCRDRFSKRKCLRGRSNEYVWFHERTLELCVGRLKKDGAGRERTVRASGLMAWNTGGLEAVARAGGFHLGRPRSEWSNSCVGAEGRSGLCIVQRKIQLACETQQLMERNCHAPSVCKRLSAYVN